MKHIHMQILNYIDLFKIAIISNLPLGDIMEAARNLEAFVSRTDAVLYNVRFLLLSLFSDLEINRLFFSNMGLRLLFSITENIDNCWYQTEVHYIYPKNCTFWQLFFVPIIYNIELIERIKNIWTIFTII